jgi:hypothetical protein
LFHSLSDIDSYVCSSWHEAWQQLAGGRGKGHRKKKFFSYKNKELIAKKFFTEDRDIALKYYLIFYKYG